MILTILRLLSWILTALTVRSELALENLALRQQLDLWQIVRRYVSDYHGARTQLALGKDAPEPRCVQLPEEGRVIEVPEVGGLHHRYERCAA